MLVPNQFPKYSSSYKLALIGEAPGSDEEREGIPFVGTSGRFLTALLSKCSIVRDSCFIGNICQVRPPGNDITAFSRSGPEIVDGLTKLTLDLERFQPNLCLLLGRTALWAANGQENIGDWRGSLFLGSHLPPFLGRKCLPSYHPAACLRQYEWTALLIFDLFKAVKNATTPVLNLPQRDLRVRMSVAETLHELAIVKATKPLIAIDIEGGIKSMSCISVATSPTSVFIVPFTNHDGTNYYQNSEDEVATWKALCDVLCDPAIPKVLQNSLYDRFVLHYSLGIVVRGVVDDTMLKHWEQYCELEKSLGFQASIYTNEPFYKGDRKTDDRETFWRYCCKDSALTYEINSLLDGRLVPASKKHYLFNVGLLNPLLYMEVRGIKYDEKLAAKRLVEINHQIYELQSDLDDCAGCGISQDESKTSLLTTLQNTLCYKRDFNQPKKGHEEDYALCKRILEKPGGITKSDRGYLGSILGTGLNIKGADLKDFLYKTLALPVQRHPVTDAPTTNYEALLKLSKKSSHPAIKLSIEIGSLRTRSQMLGISADNDGRIRCGYNAVGTETGRITCYTSPTGSGYNLQTIPSRDELKPVGHPLHEGMRDLFVADPGHYLFQCDLSGADGWTVAAHLARLGDSTMLDDYRAGIKPAKRLCYCLRHGAASLNGKTREEIKALTGPIKSSDWDYFACKIGQHGTCYLMGPIKLANQIFIQSEGTVNISSGEVKALQNLFLITYRVSLWHNWMRTHLRQNNNKLTAASGHTRKFFGRETEILGEALAHEPQANTTFSTNLAAWNLWTDKENRVGNRLRVEPLHQVHDALLGQFKIEDTEWAIKKINQWFNNVLVIAGQQIVIPFEGAYGTSWGNLKVGKI